MFCTKKYFPDSQNIEDAIPLWVKKDIEDINKELSRKRKEHGENILNHLDFQLLSGRNMSNNSKFFIFEELEKFQFRIHKDKTVKQFKTAIENLISCLAENCYNISLAEEVDKVLNIYEVKNPFNCMQI